MRFTPYGWDRVDVDVDRIVMGASRCRSGSSSAIEGRNSSSGSGVVGVGSLTTTSVSILCCILCSLLNWSARFIPVGAGQPQFIITIAALVKRTHPL